MINNKAAPSYFNGGTLVEYNDYRLFVISKLTKLQMLDHKAITPEERMQSQAVYGTGRLVRYNEKPTGQKTKTRNNSIAHPPTHDTSKLKSENESKKIAEVSTNKNVDPEKKVKRKNSKRLDKSHSLIETGNVDKSLENLPDLETQLNLSKKAAEKITRHASIPDLEENPAKASTLESLEMLPEMPELLTPQLDTNINEQTQLNDLEMDHHFIVNELSQLNLDNVGDGNADMNHNQLPEYIPPPSPTLALIDELPESLPNPNELGEYEHANSGEQFHVANMHDDFIPDELPELPAFTS